MSIGLIPKSLMDGWVYEGPDASVGIFEESWSHDACPDPDADFTECDVEIRRTGGIGAGVDHFTIYAYRVRCSTCGHAIRWTERDWEGA